MATGGPAARPLSVSQATALAKGVLEGVRVTLEGEVSEVSDKPGYKAVYFTVKDEAASLPCMIWKNRYRKDATPLRVGGRVRLTGRFTLYAAKGRMNFDVFSIALAGEGDLRERVNALARKLQAEGLMSPARKRRLPALPQEVGLVTSPRGAAVHDVLRTMRRRCPMAHVLLAGVPVEGANAARDMARGIECVVAAGAELVLLVRGGGAFEDLMPFNDEGLARAIAACPVPVVTGIGHEPDTSIADMVADVRASTPTAAAEAAVPDAVELQRGLDEPFHRMGSSLDRSLQVHALALDRLASRPMFRDARMLFAPDVQAVRALELRMRRAIPQGMRNDREQLDAMRRRLLARGATLCDAPEAAWRLKASRLGDLSPLAVIDRGYALVRDGAGGIVRSVDAVKAGDAVELSLADGVLACTVDGKRKDER